MVLLEEAHHLRGRPRVSLSQVPVSIVKDVLFQLPVPVAGPAICHHTVCTVMDSKPVPLISCFGYGGLSQQ